MEKTYSRVVFNEPEWVDKEIHEMRNKCGDISPVEFKKYVYKNASPALRKELKRIDKLAR